MLRVEDDKTMRTVAAFEHMFDPIGAGDFTVDSDKTSTGDFMAQAGSKLRNTAAAH